MRVKTLLMPILPSFLRTRAARIEASPLGYRLARGAFWSLAGAVISKGLGIVSAIVVARVLGKAGFGELGVIYSTIVMFQVFAGFSLGMTASKYVAQFRSSDSDKAGRIIALSWVVSACTGGLCAVLLFIFAPWLASHTLAAPHLGGLIRIASVVILISALNRAQEGALSGFEAFKTIAARDLIVGTVTFPLTIAGVLLAGLEGILWAMIASELLSWCVCHLGIRREARRFSVPLQLRGHLQEFPILWKFSIPAVLSGLMVMPVSWACNAILVNQPNGYAEMGVLNAANQWHNALLFIPGILAGSVLPVLSERLGSGDARQSREVLRLSIGLNALVVVPVALVGCIASPLIMRLYGDSFGGGWPVLVVVLITAAVMAVLFPIGQLIAASGRMWVAFVTNVLWAIVVLSTTVLWVRFGSLGVASARLVAYLCHATWMFGVAYLVIKRLRGHNEVSSSRPRLYSAGAAWLCRTLAGRSGAHAGSAVEQQHQARRQRG